MNNKQETNTQKFMQEYSILTALEKAAEEMDEPEEYESASEVEPQLCAKIATLVTPFDEQILEGEIRLLSQPDQLTYGVVLPWDWRRVLLVPFSHMRNPATDLEMYAEKGEERGMFQQVYQIWNARTVNKTVLAKSWSYGMISDEEKARLNKMLRSSLLNEPVEENLCPLTGTPLSKGRDIRRDYMNSELSYFAPLDKEDFEEEQRIQSFFALWQQGGFETERMFEAAAGEQYLSSGFFWSERGIEPLGNGIKAEDDFQAVARGTRLPNFTWYFDALPNGCRSGMPVHFHYRTTQQMLGSGILEGNEKDGFEVTLQNTIPADETPEIKSPADIILMLCKDE